MKWLRLWGFLMKMNMKPYILRPFVWSLPSGQCTLQGESARELTHARSWGQEPTLRTLHSARRVSSRANPHEIMGTGARSHDTVLSKESQLASSPMRDHGDRSLLSWHCTLQGESARELTHVRSWGQEPALRTMHSPRRVSSRAHPCEIMETGACSHDTVLSKESQLASSPTWDHGDRSPLSWHCTLQGESARELTHVRSWGQEPALMTLYSPRRVSSRAHPREIMGTGARSQDTALSIRRVSSRAHPCEIMETGACSHDTVLSKESQLASSPTWDHGDRSPLSGHCTLH